MNLEKLLSILLDRALFFSSTSILAKYDKYEGQPTPEEIVALGVDLSIAKELEEIHHRNYLNRFFFGT
jgi:hypothetical protein